MNNPNRLTFRRRVISVVGLLVILMVVGTVGYRFLEGWAWDESLFMTVITLSTVGYREVQPLSDIGMMFTVVLILLGVGAAAYTFTTVADYIVAGELRGVLRRQRMERTIAKMRGHYVICGYGRVGKQVVEGLRHNRFDVVVVDSDPSRVDEFDLLNVHYVIGDAADERVLSQAGIERAVGLCTCLPTDAANVFTILSARTMNPGLFIISRCNAEESEAKLHMAGASQVINPYLITGHRMAALLLHPGATEFLDVIMRQGDLELRIEEIALGEHSDMNGNTIADCRVRSDTGVNILAVRRPEGGLYTDLGNEFVFQAGDALICLGTARQLAMLASRADAQREPLHTAS